MQITVVLLLLCFVGSPVVVADLIVLKDTDGTLLKLVASTYGRGVWQSGLLTQEKVDNGCTGNTNPILLCANDIATTFNNSGTVHLDNLIPTLKSSK